MSDRPRRAIPPHGARVNALIAKSRREHALQSRSRRHEPLPTSLFTPLALGHQLRVYSRTRVAGPLAPRSWAYPATTLPTSGNSSPAVTPDPRWRARALRWILMHIGQPSLIPHEVLRPDDEGQDDPDESAIPTLREMCVRTLISAALGAESQQPAIYESIFDPDLPAHIRRFIVRCAAIHSPLPWPALEELWGVAYTEQGADGEVILVGKDAGGSKVSGSAIKSILTPPEPEPDPEHGDDAEELSWDAEEYTSPPLTTLISIAHPLSRHVSLFPPTITHLALIAVPLDPDTTPRVLMSRLSGGLRLLEALDLSCNSWLVMDAVDAVDWSKRWLRLRSIAFINCPNLGDQDAATNTINSKRNWERIIHIDFA